MDGTVCQHSLKAKEISITESYPQALEADSVGSSHPIEVPVKRASDVLRNFDDISYAKGSNWYVGAIPR